MKKVFITIKNANGETLPIGDVETFTVFMAEIPMVGDRIYLDDEENIYKDDQTSYLNFFCLMELPKEKSPGFTFRVVERTIFRVHGESWVCIDLKHEPERIINK